MQQSLHRQSLILFRKRLKRPLFTGGGSGSTDQLCSGGKCVLSSAVMVSKRHAAATAPEWRAGAEAEAGLFFFGKWRAMGGKETLLATMCPDSARASGRSCPEGLMWRRPELGSLALLLRGRPGLEACAGDGGGVGHGLTGLAEPVGIVSIPRRTCSCKSK